MERSSPRHDFGVVRYRNGEFAVCDFTLPAGYRMDDHAHDRPGIVLPLEGGWRARSSDGDVVAAGDRIAVLPEGMRHRERAPAGSRCLLVTVDPARRAADSIDLERPGSLARPDLVGLGRTLVREFRATDPAAPLVVEGLLLELFDPRTGPSLDRPGVPAWMDRIVDLIRDRWAESFTHGEIAAEAGVSREHLARTFRSVQGVPIGAWVRRIRVVQAARRLRTEDAPIATIAARCGFADQSHLTRLFRRHYTLTPAQYRRRVRGAARSRSVRP